MNFKFSMESNNKPEPGPYDSKERLVADKFINWLKLKKIETETLNTEEAIRDALIKSHINLIGTTPEQIIAEFKKRGYFAVVVPSKIKKEVVIERIETEHVSLKGLTEIEDEEIKENLKNNEIYLRKDIFRDEKELNDVHEKALRLGKDENVVSIEETIEYYYQFADNGLIKGGRKEVDLDY